MMMFWFSLIELHTEKGGSQDSPSASPNDMTPGAKGESNNLKSLLNLQRNVVSINIQKLLKVHFLNSKG